MADIDPSRAALVTSEYRYAIKQDPTIKSKFANAIEIEIDTTLYSTGGDAMATEVFSIASGFTRAFQYTCEGVMYPEDFVDSFPRRTLSFAKHPVAGNGIYTAASVEIDYLAGTIVETDRG